MQIKCCKNGEAKLELLKPQAAIIMQAVYLFEFLAKSDFEPDAGHEQTAARMRAFVKRHGEKYLDADGNLAETPRQKAQTQ